MRGQGKLRSRKLLSVSGARVPVPAGPRRVIDLTSLEFDDSDPFHIHATHRRRWLATTSIATVSIGAMISAVMFMTFGLGGFEGPTAASRSTANLWQRSASALKGDRLFALRQRVDRAALARLIESEPYKHVSASFAPSEEEEGAAALSRSGLIGSLAPDYQLRAGDDPQRYRLAGASAADPEITGSVSNAAPDKPVILPASIGGVSGPGVLDGPGLVRQTLTLTAGDTLFNLLAKQGGRTIDAQRLVSELESLLPTRTLRDGQKIDVVYQTGTDDLGRPLKRLVRLTLPISRTRSIIVAASADGGYKGIDTQARLASAGQKKDGFRARARIRSSLYLAARKQGIPQRIIVEIMRIHAYSVDFQREIKRGDTFEVFYAQPKHKPEKGLKQTEVLYSSLTLGGKTQGFYRFKAPDTGIVDYFDKDGRSATKFLIRTPLKFIRISSPFGPRRHPILGYTKLHTGVDFAARKGTPIKAGASGIIEKIGRVGGFGNYIRIRHANGYKTAYAHMAGFASGLKVGSQVRQGRVIGYVGSTGRSTGYHLHYEVRLNDKPVNPLKVRQPSGRRLTGKILSAFQKERARIDRLRRNAPVGTRVASAS